MPYRSGLYNIVTDMEIEIAKKNQSPDVQNVINTDKDFESVMSKFKRKREKRKQKLRKKEQGYLLFNSTILEKQFSNQSSISKSRVYATSKFSSPTLDKIILIKSKNKPTKVAKKNA
jgi:hypothetical protein